MKGIYALIISVDKAIQIKIGGLGELTFPEGLYAYVGSAQNNLELRVARHRRREKSLFWHIDYLVNDEAAKVTCVYFAQGSKTDECRIARLFEKNAKPIVGFGCSDCRCKSHLFRVQDFGFIRAHMQPLEC